LRDLTPFWNLYGSHGFEGVKKPPEEEKHFTQRRKGLEGAKKTKLFFSACLCAFAPWRELFDFFTRSFAAG
jgi:hypothetical protein